METDKVPLEKGSPEEILKKLGDNFSLDDGVVEALLRLGVESLQEFRFLWASEQAIETWVAKLGLGDKALLMTARVRRAWAAVGLSSSGARSIQDRIVGPGYHARGDRAARHQAAVLEALQDAFPPRDPPCRHHHFQGSQRDAEAHALRLQHLASQDPAIPAHHIAEEAQAQRRAVPGRRRG